MFWGFFSGKKHSERMGNVLFSSGLLCAFFLAPSLQEEVLGQEQPVSNLPFFSSRPTIERTLRIPSHGSLFLLLKKEGFSTKTIEKINLLVKPKWIYPGQTIQISYVNQDHIEKLTIPLSIYACFTLTRQLQGTYSSKKETLPVESVLVRLQGTITHSLFQDLIKKGISNHTALALLKSLVSVGIQWRKDLQSGTLFSIVYKETRNTKTKESMFRGIYLAKFKKKNGEILTAVRYCPPGTAIEKFYNDRGMVCAAHNTTESMFCRPLDGGKLSSHFGPRMHPIFHRCHNHKGIDFSAPSGTPVRASRDGKIAKIGWFGGYGKYIRLVHQGDYDTAYAHLKAFSPGLCPGKYIKKGQIIGYVGSTGNATGAHLHFEILHKKKAINPLRGLTRNASPKVVALTEKQKIHFRAYMQSLLKISYPFDRVIKRPISYTK